MKNNSKNIRRKGQLHIIWNKLSKNKSAVAGLIVAIMLVFIAVFAGLIVNYEKEVINQNISNRFQTYSKEHILGTDMFGRDLLARIIYGARLSMYIGTVSVLFSALFGVMLGSVSAYYGGKTDNIIMRVMDILQSLPQVMLALTIVAALGQSNENIIMAISISGIPAFTRLSVHLSFQYEIWNILRQRIHMPALIFE